MTYCPRAAGRVFRGGGEFDILPAYRVFMGKLHTAGMQGVQGKYGILPAYRVFRGNRHTASVQGVQGK